MQGFGPTFSPKGSSGIKTVWRRCESVKNKGEMEIEILRGREKERGKVREKVKWERGR